MKGGKRLCDEGAEEVDGSALFATCEQGRRTFITSSHWKRGAVHQIIHCAKMQIQIPHRELRPYTSFSFFCIRPSLHPSHASGYFFADLLSFFFFLFPSSPSVPFIICWSNAYFTNAYFTINPIVRRVPFSVVKSFAKL